MYDKEMMQSLIHAASHFFVSKEGKLYKRGLDSAHKLVVVEKGDQMRMLTSAHNSLRHRGAYAIKNLIAKHFWWLEYERDVHWYCKTCQLWQEQQKPLLKIPPIIMHMLNFTLPHLVHADSARTPSCLCRVLAQSWLS